MTTLNDTQAIKFFEQYGEHAVFKKVDRTHHHHMWHVKVNLVEQEFVSSSIVFAITCAAEAHAKECKRIALLTNTGGT